MEALSIQLKLSKFSKQRQMVRRFPGKGYKKCIHCWIFESEQLTQKLRKLNDENQLEQIFLGKRFEKFWFTSVACPLFGKLSKYAIFYSALVRLASITASRTSRTKITAGVCPFSKQSMPIRYTFFYSTKLKNKENLKATTQYRTRNLCFLTYLLHQTDFITRLIGQISAKFNYKTWLS